MSSRKPLKPKNTAVRPSVSGIQNREILEFMKKHQNVAKKEVEMDMLVKIWDRMAVKLNCLYGAAKGGRKWMKSWDNMVRYAINLAKTNAAVIAAPASDSLAAYFSDEEVQDEPGSSGKKITYTTPSAEADSIMNIIGWEHAFNASSIWLNDSQDSDEDNKENDDDYVSYKKMKSPEGLAKPPTMKLKRCSFGQAALATSRQGGDSLQLHHR